MPGMPASPLAGGQAAAAGGAYMDAHGNQIILPANFAQGCPSYGPEGCGPYGPCDYGYGGYDENAYADFGGYSQPDQCGPHYFDIAVSGVAIRGEELFNDVLPFADAGVGITPTDPEFPLLDPQQDYRDYEPGWQIAARYDIGALAVLEATYMGVYDLGFNDSVFDPTAQLTTVYSQYGLSPVSPIAGLEEDVDSVTLDYQSDLQSTEFSYRRYWVGYSPRISGTYLAGFRYIRLAEELNFDTTSGSGDASFLYSGENDLVGAQVGGDGWISILQGLRIGAEAKAGLYNNRFEFLHTASVPDPRLVGLDLTRYRKDDQAAFAGELSVSMVADVLPSFSIRVDYRALYLNSLATVGNNIFPNEVVDAIVDGAVNNRTVLSQADALYHGLNAGIEYVW
jgi:hypothetical protein